MEDEILEPEETSGAEEEGTEVEVEQPEEEVEVEIVDPSTRTPFNEDAIRKQEEEDLKDLKDLPRSVQQRIGTLHYHVKERERQLADLQKSHEDVIRYGTATRSVIEQQAQQIKGLQEALKKEALASREAAIRLQTAEYAAAREAQDAAREAEVQSRLAGLHSERANISAWNVPDAYVPPPVPQRQQSSPQITPAAEEWANKNRWFVEDKTMQSYAVNFANQIVAQGVAEDSPTYYNRIDAEMRKRFPEQFENAAPMTFAPRATAPAKPVTRPPVAAAPRTNATANGKRKVMLNPGQVDAARRLGIPIAEYAKYAKEIE